MRKHISIIQSQLYIKRQESTKRIYKKIKEERKKRRKNLIDRVGLISKYIRRI